MPTYIGSLRLQLSNVHSVTARCPLVAANAHLNKHPVIFNITLSPKFLGSQGSPLPTCRMSKPKGQDQTANPETTSQTRISCLDHQDLKHHSYPSHSQRRRPPIVCRVGSTTLWISSPALGNHAVLHVGIAPMGSMIRYTSRSWSRYC